jgi:hypothetical protein
MRARDGASGLAARGATARNDGLHSVDGGSNGEVPSFIATTEDSDSGLGRTNGGGKAPVSEKTWFAPVDLTDTEDFISDCPGGVCPVPWAVKEEPPVVQIDNVNHPSHYTDGGIECIEAIEAALTNEEFRGYCKGNCLKYIWREKLKGGTESLKKAQWYLDRLIQLDEAQKG